MPRRRPGVLIAFGLVNLLLGGFLLLCAGTGFIKPTLKINDVDRSADLQNFLAREISGYSAITLTIAILGVVLALGFIASGIGLMLVHGWGRIVALACAGLSIFYQLAAAVFYLGFYNPAVSKFFRENSFFNFAFMLQAGPWMSVILGVFIVLYSLLLFVGLLTGSTARAFRGGDEPDEEDYDRPRPRPRARDEAEYDDEPPRRPAPRRRPRDEEDDEDDRPPPRRAPRRGD
jgi:hypothetical protein